MSPSLPPWLSCRDDTVRISLFVQPGARRSEIVGVYQDCLKIKIAAPPVEGAANAALIDFFAKLLKIKKNCFKIGRGEFSKRKVIAFSSQNLQATVDILLAQVDGVRSLD